MNLRTLLVLPCVAAVFAGCADTETDLSGGAPTTGGCSFPPEAIQSRDPDYRGVTLYVLFRGIEAEAWACNDGGEERWLLSESDDCRGSWRWSYTPANASAPSREGPPGDYAGCDDDWRSLAPGAFERQQFMLEGEVEPGSTWIVALQVYEDRVLNEGAGGGEVRAGHSFVSET